MSRPPARAHKHGVARATPLARLVRMDTAAVDAQADGLAAFRAFVRFESREPESNRDRYYDLLWQPTLFGEGALVRVWGRRGQSARARVRTYPDRACASDDVRRLVRLRLRHGYRVTDWH